MMIICLIPILFFSYVRPNPLDSSQIDNGKDDMIFEGDMLLTKKQSEILEQADITNGSSNSHQRNGILDPTKRWPNNVLPYTIVESSYSSEEVYKIYKAIQEMNDNLQGCFSIIPHTDEEYWLKIDSFTGYGCSSYPGFIAASPQNLSLVAPGCINNGIVQHEILHALGLYHEQARSDRDDYVVIHWENIKEKYIDQFKKYSESVISHYNQPYNYDSVMHYVPTAFSKNGNYTITRVDGIDPSEMGNYVAATETDYNKIKEMYGCADYATDKPTTTPPPTTTTTTTTSTTTTTVPVIQCARGRPCIFPFVIDGVTYTSCTADANRRSKRLKCAIRVREDGSAKRRWLRTCDDSKCDGSSLLNMIQNVLSSYFS